MAKIAGKLVVLEISTDTGTTWKSLICEISSGSNKTRETTTSPLTKCDNEAAAQEITPLGYSIRYPFDALVDTAPSGTQLTYGDLLTIFVNATLVKIRRQYNASGTEFYEVSDAYLLSLSEASPADGFVGFSGEFASSGALDITV